MIMANMSLLQNKNVGHGIQRNPLVVTRIWRQYSSPYEMIPPILYSEPYELVYVHSECIHHNLKLRK